MALYLSVNNITKSFGYHDILSGVSLTVNDGDRVGLVGANGVGKSTLLRIIAGALKPDGGAVRIGESAQIGYLRQELRDESKQSIAALVDSALAPIVALERRLRELEAHMASAGDDLDGVMQAYGEALEKFERAGGYEVDHRVETIFDGLGLAAIGLDRLVGSLSGGEQSRLGLARLLLQAPDVLLLDEPTNHLDAASLAWLETYLRRYAGGALIVSHDREFLNETVTAVVEIDESTRVAKRYAGDYDSYAHARQAERRQWAQDYARQQDEIKALQLEAKVTARRNNNYRTHRDGDKLIVNVKKATQQSTVSKRIRLAEEKLKRITDNPIPKPPNELRFRGDIDPGAFRGRSPLIANRLCKAYGGRMIVADLSFALGPRSRVALVGPNGAGKSTLLRMLIGDVAPDSGEARWSPSARVAYLDQGADLGDPDRSLWEAFSAGVDLPERGLKAIAIASGLFRYDDLDKRVGDLSSGQRRKLQVGRLIAGEANALVLDEPTNFISFDVLEGLEAALQAFPGPVIAASHDRRFLRRFGGEIWVLNNGRVHTYLGGYDEYAASL